MRNISMLAITLLFSCSVLAGKGWTNYGQVVALETNTNANGVEIKLSGESNGACSVASGRVWGIVKLDDPVAQQHIALAYLAFSMGKKVRMYCPEEADWTQLSNIQIEYNDPD